MSYQVLARKWRPQRFDDVVGQQPVTRTLRNALASGRIAQSFVFAGSRGCGKTTTARILARALNCVKGPTGDPCGECDACIEIAQGRDMDVLEIDAASHTGIDNIREVVIAGLSISPVRDRYKVFIIDEVHQLSAQSFNALLKSIEEPPAHVVFMMATTELHKIPDTILSRSQVFEFRTIPAKAIVAQLRKIADAESVDVSDDALALIARSAEGSMRDAQSALDQVMAFAGATIAAEDVSAVLGLVGRDLLFDLVTAVVEDDGPRALALADRAVESGQDLRLVCRELSIVMRDMMLHSVDPTRESDLLEGERARLVEIGEHFSREDLMRAFDLLAKTEQEIRGAAHPRYHFEMALLKWMHLRKLVPFTELLEQLGPGGGATRTGAPGPSAPTRRPEPPKVPAAAASLRPTPTVTRPSAPAPSVPVPSARPSAPSVGSSTSASAKPPSGVASLKDALLAEIRSGKAFLYNTVVAQAQKIEVVGERVTFTFLPHHKALKEQLEQARGWLETAGERLAGRKITLVTAHSTDVPETQAEATLSESGGRDLKVEALTSSAVQTVLDVFPGEIKDVEELP